MALTNSYITLDYLVQDINVPNTDALDITDQLEGLIQKHESKFLSALFGHRFYQQVFDSTNFGNSPIDGTTTPYTNLIQGAVYTMSNGLQNVFEGLTGEIVNGSGGYLSSPIANYCYWQWMRQSNSQTEGLGEVGPSAENAERVSPSYKMVEAWNEMVGINWRIHEFLIENQSDFPQYVGHTYTPILNPPNDIDLMPNQKLFVYQNTLGL